MPQTQTHRQLEAVRNIMVNNRWYTLHELRNHTGFPEASISARLRDLRKPQFGRLTVEKRRLRYVTNVFEYRVVQGA